MPTNVQFARTKNTTWFSETYQNNIKTKKKSEAFLEKENGSGKYSLAWECTFHNLQLTWI